MTAMKVKMMATMMTMTKMKSDIGVIVCFESTFDIVSTNSHLIFSIILLNDTEGVL